jgi:hypothetical protein
MNLLDLYETREPYQQAIDRLEARRIEDLNTKMDDLIARAREAKTPEHKAGLAREFQKCKDERDGYYKIKEQQVPNNTTPAHKGIGDLQDPKQKMAQLQQKAKKGPLANVGAGLKAFFKGEPEPMDEQQVDQSSSGPRAFGVANFQRLVKANMGNIPTVTLEFANPVDNIKLDKKGIDLISDYYDSLDSDSTKNHFIYRVLPSADETNAVLKRLGWQTQTQQDLPGIPTQGELPLQEKKKFNKDEPVKSADVKVDRELQKLRAQYPAAGSDLETVARAEIDSTERSQRQLAAIRGANEKQDALLKQLVQLDQDQGREIDGLDQENDTLEQRLAQVQATNDRLQQAIGQMTGNKKSTTKTNKPTADVAQGGIIDVAPQVVTVAPAAEPAAQTVKQQPAKSAAIGAMARQIQGFNEPAPSIRSAPANDPQQQVAAESVDDDWYDDEDPETELRSGDYVRDTMDGEHGEIFRMQGDPYERRVRILDRDGKGWYIEPSRLIRVDADDIDVQKYFGKRRRDVDESALKDKADLDAKRKALQDLSMNPGVDQKAVQQRKLDLEKEANAKGLGEGWSDAMVARRTGQPRTPYSVYIKGKKWKDFENDDHARAVMDKLKAKFKADGRDPETITIAPTDMSEAISKKDLVGRLQKDLPKVTDPKNKNAEPVAWTGPGKDDYGYTGYQGHGMPTDKQERARIRADKKKGVAEGLLYSGDTWQDVLYRINVLNDIFGDQKDLAASFEPASQPEWIPFRDRILRSRTVLDTYAKVKQLANMNVPLTDVEIEMLADVAWDGGGGPVEPAGHWGERDYDWLEDLYAQQFAVVSHLLDQKAQGRGQNKTKSGQTVHEQGMAEGYERGTKVQHPKYGVGQIVKVYPNGMIAVNFPNYLDPVDKKPGIQGNFMPGDSDYQSLKSGMAEGLMKEPTTRKEYLDQRDKLFRMMSMETNPANKQIIKQAINDLEARYGNLKNAVKEESSTDSEAVEIAIIKRILVAHTDLIMEFGLDKVTQAIEEVAYNVGDVDEIGTSDVSAYVHQVKQILGADTQELDEKQDACYNKVKSRYKVWPSAYASGALVQCRKKGAANWGNKSKK